MAYPAPIQNLIDQFSRLPSVGEKTAQRFVFFLLRQSGDDLLRFAKAVMSLHDTIRMCSVCHNYADATICALCSDPGRDKTTLCVVAYPHDVAALEKTGEYRGLYHILGGNVNILEGVTPNKLKIKELAERILNTSNGIVEVILGFNPDMEGESTNLYLSKVLKSYKVRVTRLARGLPRGADIEYADEVTLGDAIKTRREI